VAEDSGLIAGVGEWVLAAAARAAAGWPAGAAGATVWANVSARQLARPGLAATIRRVLDEAGLRPASLGIEVTESAVGEHEDVVGELLRVADLGVRIALDDFGTGYSSIARLRALPVDLLKIDRSFVAALGEPGGVATVAAIVDLGHALGKTVIAEGVESEEQLAALRRTGCDEVAGFLLARPVPPAELPGAARAGEERLGGPDLRLAL
jgi:EAL domain-containing protein (putative c-di-GMP-specific phosphodiesterase class I)